MSKLSDEWMTPQWLFDELNSEFHFDIDLCATRENSKCMLYTNDYLNFNQWMNHKTAWMNPPYSNPRPFIEKAWDDSRFCKIVCLVKTDHSTRWWATFWNYEGIISNIKCEHCKFSSGYGINGHSTDSTLCQWCQGTGEYKSILYGHRRGPKSGCEVRFLPKRVKFDRPKCPAKECVNGWNKQYESICNVCNGLKLTKLSGPTFPSSLIIMDRGNI